MAAGYGGGGEGGGAEGGGGDGGGATGVPAGQAGGGDGGGGGAVHRQTQVMSRHEVRGEPPTFHQYLAMPSIDTVSVSS